MKGLLSGQYYASTDALPRVYSLGGFISQPISVAGNMSVDFALSSQPAQTLLMSNDPTSPGQPSWGTGLQIVLAGAVSPVDQWSMGWLDMPSVSIPQGAAFASALTFTPNSLDFPAGFLTSPLPAAAGTAAAGTAAGGSPGLPTADVWALMTGVYASPVGCLCTHVNEVLPGQNVAQIATSIAHPQRGYWNNYNFFDPDNFLSSSAMLASGDPYLYHQVKQVLLRSGNFMLPTGQLPHHFEGVLPVFQALSGEIQTGPNVFWMKSCFAYAAASGDLAWLRQYMPTLRLASSFLFDLISPDTGLAFVPGSLMIDVFIRNNFTSDTNAMLVGFLREFADAEEEVMGNATGAASLRSIADGISAAMNKYLWASPELGDDHFVTQMFANLTSFRDFVDYDANLIAAAHGIPDLNRTTRLLARIDGGGQCRASATYVSERYYGKADTTDGNTGDSACAMGRIAWFDALARRRLGDDAAFRGLILDPLMRVVLGSTWVFERLRCNGSQDTGRTPAYFEYPSVVVMLLQRVKYGIDIGFTQVSIAPLGVTEFTFQMGSVLVAYSAPAQTLTAVLPSCGGNRTYSVAGMAPGTAFTAAISPPTSVCVLAGPSGVPATAGPDGVVRFVLAVGGGDCAVNLTPLPKLS